MKLRPIITGVTVLATSLAASTWANSITFPVSTSSSDGALSAEADLSINNSGQVVITLKNFEQNPTSAGQLISGVVFDVTGATGAGSFTSSGIQATIGSGGSYSPGAAGSLSHWADSLSGSTITLTTLSGGQPNQMIIGPDDQGKLDGTGKYSNANSSIDNFNPSVLGSATFTLTIPGVTSSSTLSNVKLEFGTGPDTVVGPPSTVPDGGSTVTLLGAALCGLGVMGRRLRKD